MRYSQAAASLLSTVLTFQAKLVSPSADADNNIFISTIDPEADIDIGALALKTNDKNEGVSLDSMSTVRLSTWLPSKFVDQIINTRNKTIGRNQDWWRERHQKGGLMIALKLKLPPTLAFWLLPISASWLKLPPPNVLQVLSIVRMGSLRQIVPLPAMLNVTGIAAKATTMAISTMIAMASLARCAKMEAAMAKEHV